MLKSSFINIEPKLLNYIEYKNFSFGIFKEDLSEALLDCRNALDKHAPKRKIGLGEIINHILQHPPLH